MQEIKFQEIYSKLFIVGRDKASTGKCKIENSFKTDLKIIQNLPEVSKLWRQPENVKIQNEFKTDLEF